MEQCGLDLPPANGRPSTGVSLENRIVLCVHGAAAATRAFGEGIAAMDGTAAVAAAAEGAATAAAGTAATAGAATEAAGVGESAADKAAALGGKLCARATGTNDASNIQRATRDPSATLILWPSHLHPWLRRFIGETRNSRECLRKLEIYSGPPIVLVFLRGSNGAGPLLRRPT